MMIEMTIANAGRWRIFENMVLRESALVSVFRYAGSGCYSAWYFRFAATCSG